MESENVYEEVPDQRQDFSLRWEIKEKFVDNEKIIKARLCARGFEEKQNFRTVQRVLENTWLAQWLHQTSEH